MKNVMVWNQPVHLGELESGAHIGTTCLHSLVGMDAIWWRGERPAASVGNYDCYIVHLFRGMTHVEQIRHSQAGALIVALPDAAFDEVFTGRDPNTEATFMRQLKTADVIGYVSESNRQFYSVLDKPMVAFPMPIGTPEFFAEVRTLPKEDFIISCDHNAGEYAPSIANVAALALIQKQTGMRVVYYNPGPETRRYAQELGLKAEFLPEAQYANYVRMAARARLGVDMYTLHGFGRNELTLAYAGTPCVGSSYTQIKNPIFPLHPRALWLDPWDSEDIADWVREMLRDMDKIRQSGIEYSERWYGFDAVTEKMKRLLQELEAIHADDKHPA